MGAIAEYKHLHKDLWDLLTAKVQQKVREIEHTETEPWEKWKEVIMGNPLRLSTSCILHPFSGCRWTATDFEIAGTICKDYSSRKKNKKGKNGPFAKFFLIWAKLQVTLQPKVILHENVVNFDVTTMQETLIWPNGPYVLKVVALAANPYDLGQEGLSRPRHITALYHSQKVRPNQRLGLASWGAVVINFWVTTSYLYKRPTLQLHSLHPLLEHRPLASPPPPHHLAYPPPPVERDCLVHL